jgi:hypothetical protein
MLVSQSAKRFLERLGVRPTHRGPVPRRLDGIRAHEDRPVALPLPWPGALRAQRDPADPDRGSFGIWPRSDALEPQ